MKLIKHDPTSAILSPAPVMIGSVASQLLVGELDAANLRVSSVTFHDGARNVAHRHSCDQVLVVTDGRGVIATEDETREVAAGDVAVIPAGELHWHGAYPGETLTHLSIVTPHETEFEEGVVLSAFDLSGIGAP